MLKSVYQGVNSGKCGMSNADTKDELHASFILSLVFRGNQGLPTIFRKDFGKHVNGSKLFSFLLKIFLMDFKGFDRLESQLFSSKLFTWAQDHLLQKLMGIEVRVEEGVDIVGPGPNGVSKWHLVPVLATQVFTVLSGYRIGCYYISRRDVPTSDSYRENPCTNRPSAGAHFLTSFHWDKLKFTFSVSLTSKTGFPFFSSSRLFWLWKSHLSGLPA